MIAARARYFLSELVRNLKRQPLLVLTTVATVATSLVLVGFFVAIWVAADELLERFAEEVHLTAYLDPAVGPDQAREVLAALRGRPEVADLRLLSAEEDRERNRALLPPDVARDLPDRAVPGQPCVDVVLRPEDRRRSSVRRIVETTREIEGVAGVASVLSGGEKVQLAFAVVDAVRTFGLLVAILLASGAVYFVFSTIRLSVHARKEEIATRRLMGATRTFIRIPFFLEGITEGGLGALLAVGVVLALLARFNAYLQYSQLLRYSVDVPIGLLLGSFLLGGAALGLLGSALALGRYLKGHG